MTAAAEVAVPGQHHEDVDTVGRRWRTGVVLIIVADVAFVGALIFSYFYLRGLNTQASWVTKGSPTASIWVGWVIAAILIASAWSYRWGLSGLRTDNITRLASGVGVAVLLVVADGVAQIIQMVSFAFKPDANAYASSIYTLAGANLFHLLLTLFLGIGLWNRTRIGKYSAADGWQVEIISIWWTWIAIAAVASAVTTSFIASPNVGG
jgi:heme/copper-type cytochrome/quinol oxidase subunit 3